MKMFDALRPKYEEVVNDYEKIANKIEDEELRSLLKKFTLDILLVADALSNIITILHPSVTKEIYDEMIKVGSKQYE